MRYRPKLSFIIAVKNAKLALADTLDSIRQQTYQPLEVIVIDGGSTDDTIDIIQQNTDLIQYWISETDNGISDAFNKGLQRATGTYINFQGAGDTLYAGDGLERLFDGLDDSYELVCGKIMRVKEDGVTPIWEAPRHDQFHSRTMLFKMALPHQGLFTHQRYFEKFGQFDIGVRFAMDYELLLRAYHQFPKTILKNILISRWRAGGVGSNRIDEIFDEYHRIKCQHEIAPLYILNAIDMFSRVKYHLKTRWLKLAY